MSQNTRAWRFVANDPLAGTERTAHTRCTGPHILDRTITCSVRIRLVISGPHALFPSNSVTMIGEEPGFRAYPQWREQFPAAHSALAPSTGSADESTQQFLQRLKRLVRPRLHTL